EADFQTSSLERIATATDPRPTGAPPTLGTFAIAATLNDHGGLPIVKPVVNGETIAVQALVPLPVTNTPILSETLWQLIDAQGRPVPGYFEGVGDWETGGTRDARARFTIRGLRNGTYAIRLTHRLPQWIDAAMVAEVPFSVFHSVGIDQLWVTDTEDDVVDKEVVLAGQTPHLYMAYHTEPGVTEVLVKITARNQDGAVLGDREERIPNNHGNYQRVGLTIDSKRVDIGDRVIFDAEITGPDGKPQKAAKTVQVIGHPVAITAPPSLESGRPGEFSIFVPPYFVPPLRIYLSAPGLDVDQAPSKPLEGFFSGTAHMEDEILSLHVQVTDREDRIGVAEAHVIVTPTEQSAHGRTPAVRGEQSNYAEAANISASKPAPSLVTPLATDFASPVEPRMLEASRGAGLPPLPQPLKIKPAAPAIISANYPVSGGIKTATTAQSGSRQEAPKSESPADRGISGETFHRVDFSALASDARAALSTVKSKSSTESETTADTSLANFEPEQCRKSFDNFRKAVISRNRARSRIDAYHKTFISTAGPRSRQASLDGNLREFENLWSSLADEKDCGIFAFSVKDHPIARAAGYDASLVLKVCRQQADAAAAMLSARFLLQEHNCIAPGGLLRAGILDAPPPLAPNPKTAIIDPGQ
ncbi:MAG: hypothetical protein HQ511_12660, partial [Rhodospirillales bacterium]|nr:hypothetical protein [Rhodospirillales bacterium]